MTGLSVEGLTVCLPVLSLTYLLWYTLIVKYTNRESKQRELSWCALWQICRHTLNLGIMGCTTCASDLTRSKIFTAWAIRLSTLLDQLDLCPCPGEVLSLYQRIFMHQVSRTLFYLVAPIKTGLPHRKIMTSAVWPSVHIKVMILLRQKFEIHLMAVQSSVQIHILRQSQIMTLLNTVVYLIWLKIRLLLRVEDTADVQQ